MAYDFRDRNKLVYVANGWKWLALRPGLRTNYGCYVSFINMNGHGGFVKDLKQIFLDVFYFPGQRDGPEKRLEQA
jgi:hypothetical protein